MRYLTLALALVSAATAYGKASMQEKQPGFLQTLDWSAEYYFGGKADLKGGDYQGQSIRLSKGDVSVSYEQPLETEEFSVLADLAFETVRLNWKNNPFFAQKRFNSVKTKLGVAYPFDDYWTWELGAGADMQTKPFSLSDNTSYNLFLWGRYSYDEDRLFNIGVLSWLGIKDKRVYPILGINYRIDKQWYVNAIFPFMGSVTYMFSDEMGADLSVRWVQIRRRLRKEETLPKGIYEYSSDAFEVGGFYKLPIGFRARAFVGMGFSTKMKVYDAMGDNEIKIKMKNPLFGGLSLDLDF